MACGLSEVNCGNPDYCCAGCRALHPRGNAQAFLDAVKYAEEYYSNAFPVYPGTLVAAIPRMRKALQAVIEAAENHGRDEGCFCGEARSIIERELGVEQ